MPEKKNAAESFLSAGKRFLSIGEICCLVGWTRATILKRIATGRGRGDEEEKKRNWVDDEIEWEIRHEVGIGFQCRSFWEAQIRRESVEGESDIRVVNRNDFQPVVVLVCK